MRIKAVFPGVALPGGAVRLEMEGFDHPLRFRVRVGEVAAELLAASQSAVTLRVPDQAGDGVTVEPKEGEGTGESAWADLKVGKLVADELHMVANPAVDSDGNVYATFSGARGEKVPFSVFVIRPDGTREPFLAEITNPTGLAIGPDGMLYVSSRHTGAVYRSTLDKRLEKYVDGLGLPTGLAFDSAGNLLVGNRNGVIYRVSPLLETSVLCELEPSVSAYHMVMGTDDSLYVTGPTLSTQDSVYRVTPDGAAAPVFKGLGRPQGLAFGPDGSLQVAASHRGRKGVFTLRDGEARWTVAGPMLVGLAYNADQSRLYLADNSQLYQVAL